MTNMSVLMSDHVNCFSTFCEGSLCTHQDNILLLLTPLNFQSNYVIALNIMYLFNTYLVNRVKILPKKVEKPKSREKHGILRSLVIHLFRMSGIAQIIVTGYGFLAKFSVHFNHANG